MTSNGIRAGAIDTHAHVYPGAYLARLEQIGVDPATTAIARNLHADCTETDIQRRLDWMDRAGVAMQVLAVTPQLPAGPDGASSLEAARMINDEYARLVAEHPGRFLAYAALPIPHVAEALTEMARALEELGMVGVSVTTVLREQTSLVDPRLDELWQELDDRGAVVNIHPTGSGCHSPMITDHQLEWVNGAPVEDATATLQLLKADIPRRYPNVRFHIAHLGGDLPFLAQRIQDNYEDWHAFPASPRDTLRGIWFDAANFHEPSLRLAVETYGAERIIAGSDHPYFQDEKYLRAFEYIRTSKLDGRDISRILRENAEGLYRPAATKT